MALQPIPEGTEVIPLVPEGPLKALPRDTKITPIIKGGIGDTFTPTEQGSDLGDIGRGGMDVLTGFLDIPGNITKAGFRAMGLNPGPPDYLRRQAASIGIANEPGREPQTLGTNIGKVAGGTLIGLAPIVGPGSRMLATQGAMRSIPKSAVGEAVKDVALSAATKPGRFWAFQAGGIAGAGTAGTIAEEMAPGDHGLRAIAELTGGFAGAGAVAGLQKVGHYLPTTQVIRMVRANIKGPNPADVNAMAGRMLRGQVDRNAALKGLDDPSIFPDAPLTPAQRSGEPGVLALEKSVMETSLQLKGQQDNQIASVNRYIRESFRRESGDPVTASPDDTRSYLASLIDARLRIAGQSAKKKLDALAPGTSREQTNIVARDEVQSALTAARAQERELWAKIPMDEQRGTSSLNEAYGRVRAETARAQQGDIPQIAKTLLESEKGLGEATTVRELLGFRSSMLETARVARSNGQYNQARIADLLAEAALNDLGATRAVQSGPIRVAMDFSKDLNDRFTRGSVGRLLGYEAEGGRTTPAGLTLESSVGRPGARGREEADALMRATEKSGNQPALAKSIEDFLRNEFQKAVVREGRVDPALATTYLRNRQELLGRFPALKTQMEEAASTAGKWKAADADPDLAAASIWTNSVPETEIHSILKQTDPRDAMMRLVGLARKDPSGQAEKGIKSALADYLMQSAEGSARDVSGARFIDGAKLTDVLASPRIQRAMLPVFSKDEIGRFQQIAATAKRVDAVRSTPGSGIPEDEASYLTRTAAAVVGAAAGRALGTGTVQAPGKMAALFDRIISGGEREAARKLLREAIRDPELFRAMLVPPTSPQFAAAKARINGWATGILTKEGHDWDER